jgi:hypothetical protein
MNMPVAVTAVNQRGSLFSSVVSDLDCGLSRTRYALFIRMYERRERFGTELCGPTPPGATRVFFGTLA